MGIIEPLAMNGMVLNAGIQFASAVMFWGTCAAMLSALTGILLAGGLNSTHGA